MTFFRLDTAKAIEATATLLRLAPHRMMGRKRLLALLYFADRECLIRSGRPIIGGRLTAMPYGPVHSEVYDLIKGGHSDQAHWASHFQNENYYVILASDPGSHALSRYELGILNDVSQKYLGYDDWDVAEETHQLDEYKRTYHKGTSTPIALEDMIDAIGRGKDKAAILADAEEKTYFDRLFEGAS